MAFSGGILSVEDIERSVIDHILPHRPVSLSLSLTHTITITHTHTYVYIYYDIHRHVCKCVELICVAFSVIN